jgi:hypothetical protein
MEARPMITRYAMSWGKDEDGSIYVSPTEQPKGNWVKYEDYARLLCESVHDLNQIGGLQQELAELRAASFVTAVPCEQYERVVKAGDALYKSMLEIGCNEMADNFQYDAWWGSMNDWNAAKEGKPSA